MKGASILIAVVALAGLAYYFYKKQQGTFLATPMGLAGIQAGVQSLPVSTRQPTFFPY